MRLAIAADIASTLDALDALLCEPAELVEYLATVHPSRLTNPMALIGVLTRHAFIADDLPSWVRPVSAVAPMCREYTAWAKAPTLPGLALAALPLSRKTDPALS